MFIETVRVSAKARDELIRLKTKTQIENWNTLCRWAICHSLSVNIGEALPNIDHATDSNVEMTWRTFSGRHEELYWALVVERCRKDKLDVNDHEIIAQQFKLHLHRGIQYLAAKKDLTIAGFLEMAQEATAKNDVENQLKFEV